MPKVLTTNAIVNCPHTGVGTSTALDPTAFVNGGAVLVEGDTGHLKDCINNFQCTTYALRSMGLNATRIKGKKVILITDFNQTNTGYPLIITEAHSVLDKTTPAAIPDGQPAPPLPPEMADESAPSVTCPVTTLAFNKATMSPPTLAATFTLISAHPLKWILMQIDEPEEDSNDRSNGLPPELTVVPAGGVWSVSPLVITMTMTATFMAALDPGDHRFFMTGITQRGISSFAEVVLTVT